jgi:hypothetical protein
MKENNEYYNVYAVINGKPLAKVNARRMRLAVAESKVDKLIAEGASRAYAIKDGGR